MWVVVSSVELDDRADAGRRSVTSRGAAEQELRAGSRRRTPARRRRRSRTAARRCHGRCRGSGPASKPERDADDRARSMNAATVSSSVAAPFSTMIERIDRWSVSVVPKLQRDRVAEVFEVLHRGSAGRSRPACSALLDLLLARRARRAPPGSGRPGRPASAGTPCVSRIQTIGIASASRSGRRRAARCPGRARLIRRLQAARRRRSCWPSRSVLADHPEAEQERRVERLLDAVDAVADRRDLLALPDRDRRHVLRRELLDLREGLLRARPVVGGRLLVGEQLVDLGLFE